MGCGASKAAAGDATEKAVSSGEGVGNAAAPGVDACGIDVSKTQDRPSATSEVPGGAAAKDDEHVSLAEGAAAAQEGWQGRVAELQKLWDTVAPLAPEIVTLLQTNSVTGEVLRILARGGMQAMEVLARAPMVGPLAEVASRVMAGIAEAVSVRAAVGDFKRVVAGVMEVVVGAHEVLSEHTRALEELKGLLEEAAGLVQQVETRTWLGRFLQARGDTDGLQELAGKVLGQVGVLTAAMQVETLRGVQEIRSAVEDGSLLSSRALAERLAQEAGAERLEDASPAQLRAVLGDRGRVEAVFGLLAPGEQVLAGLVQNVGEQVAALGERVDRGLEALERKIGQVLDAEPQEVKKLPGELRRLWVDEDEGFAHVAAEMEWGLFEIALLNEELPILEEAARWYEETLAPPELAEFVRTDLHRLLAPADRVQAHNLYQLAQGAKRRGKLEWGSVRFRDVLWYVHVNGAGKGRSEARGGAGKRASARNLAAAVTQGRERGEKGEPAGGSLERLAGVLKHHDFLHDADLREAGFMVGTRGWLAEEVMVWVDGKATTRSEAQRSSNMFLLLSLPGMGKTAFTAHVALELHKAGRLLGGHFCRAGDESRTDARVMAQSLAYQLAEAVPEAATAVEEGLRELDLNGTAMDWFRSLVVGPSKGVAWAKAPVVLVIDAVDEAGADARSNGVLQMLSGCVGELPGWVRVLVTSRPEEYIVRQVARFQPFTLEPSEGRNREDIRAYIRGSLRSEGLSEDERGAVVEALEGKSGGVFAYVAALVGMVQREVGARAEGGVASMAVGDLPEGHRALYKEYFDRQFRALAERDVEVVRTRVLPALVAAVEPLSLSELQELVQHGDEDAGAAARVLGAMGSLFPVGADGRVRPFHKSVMDWLAEDKASGWHVDVRVGHALHAVVWGRKVEALGQGGGSGAVVETLGAYASVYTLHHAVEAGELGVAAGVCTSLGYVRACAEAGEVGRLVRDVARAAQALRASSHPKAASAQETRAWLRCFSAVLVSNPSVAVDAALVAPQGTWMHAAGDACAREGLVDGRVRVVGTMDGFPEAQVLASGPVDAMAFSPEGDVLGVVDKQAVSLWDTVTGARTLVVGLPDDGFEARGMQFSPSGATLAVWGNKGLYLVDCMAGSLLPLPGKGAKVFVNVHDAGLMNGGTTVGAVTERGYRQWGVPSGEELAVPAGPLAEVAALEIELGMVGGDGAWVAMKPRNSNLRVFDVQSGQLRAELEGTSTSSSREIISDGDGIMAVVSGGMLVWDAKVGKQRGLLEGSHSLVSPDGATIVTQIEGGVFHNRESWRELRQSAKDHGLYSSPDGAFIVTSKLISGGLELSLRDAVTECPWAVFQIKAILRDIQVDPTGKTLGVTTGTATWLLDMSAQQGDSPVIVGGDDIDAMREVYVASLSPDGGVLVVQAENESTARIVDARTGVRICKVDVGVRVLGMAISPDRKRGAAGFLMRDRGWALVWDMATGEMLADTEVPGADRWHGWHLCFAGEDKLYLLSRGVLYAWSPSSGEQAKIVREAVDFLSPDGERLWVWEEGSLVQEDVAGQARRVLPTRCVDADGRAWEAAKSATSRDCAWGVVAVAVAVGEPDEDSAESATKYNLCTFEVGSTRSAIVPTMLSHVPIWLAITCDGGILVSVIFSNIFTGSADLCAWDMHATPPALLCKIPMTLLVTSLLSLELTADDTLCWSARSTVNAAAAVVVRLPTQALRELGAADGSSDGSALARELRGKMMVADAACVSKECVVVTMDL